MKRQNLFRHLLAGVVALLVACNAPPPGAVSLAQTDGKTSSDADAQSAARAWDEAAKILKRIEPPAFPKHDFGVTNYGAFGDDTVDCTKAFQDAIAGSELVNVPEAGHMIVAEKPAEVASAVALVA